MEPNIKPEPLFAYSQNYIVSIYFISLLNAKALHSTLMLDVFEARCQDCWQSRRSKTSSGKALSLLHKARLRF